MKKLSDNSPHSRWESLLSGLLWGAAIFNFASALALLHGATEGFSTALPTTQAGASVVGATFAATMLLAGNLVYQLVLQMKIPFSVKMLLGFVVFEVLFSLFLWSLR